MISIVRVTALVVVLIFLALAMGPASAQEMPDGPAVAACPPGGGYASGCDVDQDSDVDILDVQRTAGHWNSTGAYTAGHTHWGETWTGATGGHGLSLDNTAASDIAYGLSARSASTNGAGVYAWANSPTGLTYGVWGESSSTNGTGVYGLATPANGTTYGVWGQSNSSDGRGLLGRATSLTGYTYGVWGQSDSSNGRGVYGIADAANGVTTGVFGESNSPSGRGVYGWANAATGFAYGVHGRSDSDNGVGVSGRTTAANGFTIGVYGHSESIGGYGVYGAASAGSGASIGVYGYSTSGAGYAGLFEGNGADALFVQNYASGRAIQAVAATDTAVWAKTSSGLAGIDGWNSSATGRGVSGYASAATGATHGVWGQSASTSGTGVLGVATAASGDTTGVYGESASPDGQGVYGKTTATSGTTYGLYGESASTNGRGVYGVATASSGTAIGVYGVTGSSSGYAGYFVGPVHVLGTLSKSAGSFKIDHPLDPANQYLSHSFVESPDMMNIYNGNATLDGDGEAWVELPAWFEALNRDFRYQLTTIGGWAPVYVARKISGNRFQIAGGDPGLEVSWQVTGIRQDAYANAHRIPVEEAKPVEEAGLYLHPVELGLDAELGLDYQRNLDPPE
ncbi:MAG: hypothetical protein IPM84_20185 [Anaerolineae bacterium]|nr:hypothetical protein [Anaerolineae bacterium]